MNDRASDFWGYLNRCSETPAQAAALCGVTPRTLQRWKRGQSPIPESAFNLLKLLARHELPTNNPAWRGWFFKNDILYSPENEPFTAGDIRATPHILQNNFYLQERLKTPEQFKLF